MRSVIVKSNGGPENLAVERSAPPVPGPGGLLVEVEAAGVNYLDVMQRQGQGGKTAPFPLGLEGVGRVRAAGAGEEMARIGQRVAWVDAPGSYAEQVIVPAARAVPVPDGFTASQALLFQPLTAQYLAAEYRDVRPGDRVLVHAAAGGVGQLLVQMLKHRGAWVAGTVSSAAKAEAARAAGADAVIDYGRDYSFLKELRALTEGRGVNLAFDSIGSATLPQSLKALARGGTVVSYGSSSGPAPAIDPGELIGPCTRVAGGSMFSYLAAPEELRRRAGEVIEGLRAGWLRLPEGTAFALDHAADAHRAIEGRGTVGKLFLRP